ncbi:hypothetical protein T4D_4692 [Trichinella pseudospiralis]|uniref:Uncharacterized protein n=1 Tax=Trichinella pseudospiralis TaxID=6337 RepID=A0A0V1G4M1_TRIPS|nr:hypothetical protein T4D_4692 [Trichinella pseudospiralis]
MRVSSTPISDFAFFHQEAEDIHCALVVCGTGPGSLVILENHRALKHEQESKLSHCDIVRKKSSDTIWQVPVVWFCVKSPGTKSRFRLLHHHHMLKIPKTLKKLREQKSNCNHGDFVAKNHRAQFGYCSQLQCQRCAAEPKSKVMEVQLKMNLNFQFEPHGEAFSEPYSNGRIVF